MRARARARARVCVCVCEREREREREVSKFYFSKVVLSYFLNHKIIYYFIAELLQKLLLKNFVY